MASDREKICEPSRGAPDAAPHEPDAFEAAWLDYNKRGVAGGWEKVAFTSGFGRGFKAGRETGHVVLLEALKKLVEKMKLIHNDPRYMRVWVTAMLHGDNYDGPNCEAELREAEAAIQQAERT